MDDSAGKRTVVCLKWGRMYGPEYVNRLYAMVMRNCDIEPGFVCFTDDPTGLRDEVEIKPLPEFEEPPWEFARYCSAWRKLALFNASDLGLSGRVLFLDLDIVILDSLEPFFEGDESFKILENWYQPGVGQASVMRFDDDTMLPVLQHYLADPLKVLTSYPTEQAYISASCATQVNMFFSQSLCASFKRHVMPHGWDRLIGKEYRVPEDARILIFHGRPNPHEAIAGEWGKPMSPLKKWWKGLKPCPWIADYWFE